MSSPLQAAEAPAIELDALVRDYAGPGGSHRALHGVSFSVARGEVLGYLGPNGAGKTTTLKILAGLLRPTSGDARVLGRSVVSDPLGVKARIGFIPESGALFLKLTPREHLEMVGQLRGLPDSALAERVPRWLATFGLAENADRRLGDLSKGNRQRTCWAAALLHDPEVLVLDEPLNGLDVAGVTLVKGLLRDLAAQGRTTLYSSHLVDVVERVCTRVAVVDRGRLVAFGTIDEVLQAAGSASLEEALGRLCAPA